MQYEKLEDDLDGSKPDLRSWDAERKDNVISDNKTKENAQVSVRDFDLNVDLDENGDLKDAVAAAPASLGAESHNEMKHEEFHGWSLLEMKKMAMNPMQLASLNGMMEDDDDYDEEG